MQVQPGSVVHVRGEDWRVTRVDAYDRCAVLTLDGGVARAPLRIIEPFDRPRLHRPKHRRRRRRAVLQAALCAIANARPALGLWTAADARIDLLPYQLEPALAVLRGATRLLLADGVGLGKTIEAGLILAELRARGWVERTLILCPPGLRVSWSTELQRRFNIACAVFDQAAIAESIATLPPGVNPWSGHSTIVTSIDLAKRDDVRAALDAIPFDLLIADEAHHLTPGTDRGEIARRLALRTPWCVFVSATPHSGDADAFHYLAGLGGHGDAPTLFRRSGPDAGRPRNRRESIVRVRASDLEVELLAAAGAYANAIWNDHGASDPAVRLVAITIARRAASSVLALRRTLLRRRALLATTSAGIGADVPEAVLPWDEHDDSDGEVAAALLRRAGLANGDEERSQIARLLHLADRTESAKVEWLVRFLARAGEPALVFTEYRDTLEQILSALPASFQTLSITGGHSPDSRRLAVEAFNRGDVDVLVATDAAGEGLNLHRRCRLVIDVELPWNPMRLEQRVGRVDRLGQTRRVHAVRLIHPGSIEERVLGRLRERRSLSEAAVAQAIFGHREETTAVPWSPSSAVIPAALAEAQRVSRQRLHASSPKQAVDRQMRSDRASISLHRLSFTNTLGSVLAEYPVAHRVDPGCGAAIDLAARIAVSAHCSEIDHGLTAIRTAMGERISRIRAHINRPLVGIQRSLFDTRAETASRRADVVRNRLDSALQRRRDSITAPTPLEGAGVTLVAVWPAARP